MISIVRNLSTFLCMGLTWFLAFTAAITADEVVVELNDPVYQGDSIATDKGGVIKTKDIRIQARRFAYEKNEKGHTVRASGDILVLYKKKFYVGKSFVYNFTTKTGRVKDGVCFIEGVFIGGKEILLKPDGSVSIYKAYATTSDAIPPQWMAQAHQANINQNYRIEAKDVVLRIHKAPVFWYPNFATNLSKKYKKDPLVTYSVFFENSQYKKDENATFTQNAINRAKATFFSTLLMARFRIINTKQIRFFVRGEYRIARGGAGAVEFDYNAPGDNFSLQTRNFYGYDSFYLNPNPKTERYRYRLQGIFKGKAPDKKIETFGRWDVLSDRFMRKDFPTKLFELKTLERTEAYMKGRYDPVFASIYGRVRVNDFQGFKQELPTATFAFKPYVLGPTGVVFENYFRLSYLDYVYAKEISNKVSDFHSSRLESKQILYRNFHLGPFQFRPFGGFDGIYYGNGINQNSVGQVTGSYGFDFHSIWKREFNRFQHYLEPYVNFYGATTPTAGVNRIYIFSIDDGFFKINQFTFGMKNSFYSYKSTSVLPVFAFDIYGLSFPGSDTLSRPVGKGRINAEWNFSRLGFKTYLGWNFQKNTFDYTNFIAGWTINEYLAFSAEIRSRSAFDWKKNDHMSFILDMARPIDELAASPISDQRVTFLGKCQIQFAPLWTLQFMTHFGKRPENPFYYENKFVLETIISNVWKAQATFSFGKPRRNQYTFGISLI